MIYLGGTFIFLIILCVLFPFWFVWDWKKARREGREPHGIGCFGLYLLGVFALAAVAIPYFVPRGCHGAKQCEAKTNLGSIFNAQAAYFDQYGTYADNFTDLNWEPEGMSKYAYFCGDDFIPNKNFPAIPRSAIPAFVAGISATGFTCIAVGNIDNDADLDYWSINDAKAIVNEPSDL